MLVVEAGIDEGHGVAAGHNLVVAAGGSTGNDVIDPALVGAGVVGEAVDADGQIEQVHGVGLKANADVAEKSAVLGIAGGAVLY